MSIKSFIEKAAGVPGASTGSPTVASKPPINGTFPIGHPKRNVTPGPDDRRAKDYSWGRSEYGANGSFTPSSIPPGTAVAIEGGELAQNADAVLDIVQEQGLARPDRPSDWQERQIGDKNCEDAFGAESARTRQASSHSSAAVRVPQKTGAAPDDYATRYDAGLKRDKK